MLEFARWKYILVGVVLAVALLFALPNLFGDDYALQIARKDTAAMRRDAARVDREVLKDCGVTYSGVELENDNAGGAFAR